MKKFQITSIIIISLAVFSCTKKDEITIDPANLLIGTWNYARAQNNNVSTYARTHDFDDKHCYKFNTDGTLLERNISGWCGTPPVFYENYDGTWTIVNDTVIQISVEYWGGIRDYGLDIKSVDRDSLRIVYIPVK